MMQLIHLLYKNFIWRLFFYVTSFVLNIAIARKLGAVVSGSFNFFLNNISFFLLLCSLSLESGIIYYVSKKKADENVLSLFSLIWSVLNSAIIAILFYFFYKDDLGIFSSSFLFFSVISYTIGAFLTTYFSAFYYSRDNYKISNLVAGISNLILIFFIPWQKDWMGFIDQKIFFILFFIVELLQGLVIAGLWFLGNRSQCKLKRSNWGMISLVIRYSVVALVGNIAYFLLYRVDYWFVEFYCSAKSLGNYIQVSKLGQLLVLPSMIIAGMLFPQSAKDNISFQTTVFRKMIRVIAIAYCLGAIFLLLISRPLILFFWGSQYDEMYWPLVIMLPGIIFLAISYLFSPIFAGKGKVKYNVYISLLTLFVVIVSNFLLIPGWGIQGAALATSIGFLTMMIIYIIIANKKLGLSLRIY